MELLSECSIKDNCANFKKKLCDFFVCLIYGKNMEEIKD